MENESSIVTVKIDESINEKIEEHGSIFFWDSCDEIPEFTFDEFPIVKVLCKKANPKHNQQLNFEINNVSKEECKKNLDNIKKNFSNSLLMAYQNQNNNVKDNDNNGINLKSLNNEDINILKKI